MARLIWRGVVAMLFLGVVAAGTARAQAPVRHGWWWAEQVSTGPAPARVPAPPWVPPDGLYVASTSEGDDAMSALAFEVPNEMRAATLTLHVNSTFGSPILRLCTIVASWQPEQGGYWSNRPTTDCEHIPRVFGTFSSDATTVSFNVPSAFSAPANDGVLDVAVVPGLLPDGTRDTYYASFESPGNDALAVAPEPEGAATISDPPTATSPTTSNAYVAPSLADQPSMPKTPSSATGDDSSGPQGSVSQVALSDASPRELSYAAKLLSALVVLLVPIAYVRLKPIPAESLLRRGPTTERSLTLPATTSGSTSSAPRR